MAIERAGIYQRVKCGNKTMWAVYMMYGGRARSIGQYPTKEAAEAARKSWLDNMARLGISTKGAA